VGGGGRPASAPESRSARTERGRLDQAVIAEVASRSPRARVGEAGRRGDSSRCSGTHAARS
jgi:hypothetical protein